MFLNSLIFKCFLLPISLSINSRLCIISHVMVYRYGEWNAWNSSKGPHVLEPFIFPFTIMVRWLPLHVVLFMFLSLPWYGKAQFGPVSLFSWLVVVLKLHHYKYIYLDMIPFDSQNFLPSHLPFGGKPHSKRKHHIITLMTKDVSYKQKQTHY